MSARIAFFLIAAVFVCRGASAQVFGGTISQTDPTMPVVFISAPHCGSQGMSMVHYESFSFSPAINGVYSITIVSGGDLASFYIYRSVFTPNQGTVNCIAGANGSAPVRVRESLVAGETYIVVPFNDAFDQTLAIDYTVTIAGPTQKPPVDFTGDSRTDYAIARNTGGGAFGDVTWWIANAANASTLHYLWGNASDYFVPGDYDGDGTTDPAIWRPGAAGSAGYWISRSSNGTVVFIAFGQTGDDPTVVADYDGDGKTDLAVYRNGASPGLASAWFYKSSLTGSTVGANWGVNGDTPAPGDYDGDGRCDFAIRRNVAGSGQFWINQSTAGTAAYFFGLATDLVVSSDFDGDNKTDLAIIRNVSGARTWWVRNSSNGIISSQTFGVASTDYPAQGDYDNDGKTDIAVWRTTTGTFWVSQSTGGIVTRNWGQDGDYPFAAVNTR